MELIFNRTFSTLNKIQKIYEQARIDKTILLSVQLEPYKNYYVNRDALVRWSIAGNELGIKLKILGCNIATAPWWLYDKGSNSLIQSSIAGTVRHVQKDNKDGEGKVYHNNEPQEIINGCIVNILTLQRLNYDLYERTWNLSQEEESSLWGDLSSGLQIPWNNNAYTNYLSITDINWLEASLYIANKCADKLIEYSNLSIRSGTNNSGEGIIL